MSDALDFYHSIVEKRERAREMFEFEWCHIIRKAGKKYRDGDSITRVAEDLDIDCDKAEEAMTVFQLIYRDPPTDVSSRGLLAGYRFFIDDYDVADLADDSERPAEKYEEDIREFVGSIYQKYDVDSVDLRAPPDEYDGETPSQIAWKAILQSNAPSAIDEVVEAPEISPIGLDIDFSPLTEALEEYQGEVNQALQQSIQNFDSPDSYDPNQTSVDQFAKQAGKRILQRFIDDLEELDDEPIQAFLERLHRGLGAYESEDYMLACFAFISIQDGLMMTLCLRDDEMERGEDGYFTPQQRKTALKNSYEEVDQEFRDLESDDVIPQAEFHTPVRTAVEQLVEQLDTVIGIVLYGSVARGTADRRSDIDLWVLVEEDRMANQRTANTIRQDLEDQEFDTGRYAYEIDVEALPAVPNYTEELQEILSDGIVVRNTEKFDTVREMVFHGEFDE